MTKEERIKAAAGWLEKSRCNFTYPEAYALTNKEVEEYASERAEEAFIKGAEAEAESKWVTVRKDLGLPKEDCWCYVVMDSNVEKNGIKYVAKKSDLLRFILPYVIKYQIISRPEIPID